MQITRRTLLSGAVALSGGYVMPQIAWANANLSLGSTQLDTLSDGHLVLPRGFLLPDTPKADADAILAEFAITGDTLEPDCNLTLWRSGDHVILFDAGSGPDFMPTAGKMMSALDALGLTIDDVTAVVFTHAHPDHLWGVLDDFDEPLFPNATYHMGQIEFDFWTDPAVTEKIDANRLTFAVGAARRLAVLADQINLFADADEILPGVIARATFGHTPGHMSFELRDGEETLLIIGDAIGNHHVAFARPQWASGADQNTAMGIATRTALLGQLADSTMPFVGFHMPHPGIGTAVRDGDAFRYVPMT